MKKNVTEDWRYVSEFKSVHCFCKRPKFGSQNPHQIACSHL